jgi:four helix bundle protein
MIEPMVLRADPRRLLVSEVAEEVAKGCAELAKTFRGPGAFARGDQLVRASLSIPSNIAEACGRGTVADFRRFLLHARGSTQEVLAQLRLVEPASPDQSRLVRVLHSRTVFVLKLINRLYAHPPPDR